MANISINLSSLNGSNGFIINGIAGNDFSGFSVSDAGDVNGDGVDDLIIGAPGADPEGIDSAGQSYVVFGNRSGFPASLNLPTLNGSNGFAMNGIAAFDNLGISVSGAGDVNGDGLDDVAIGVRGADSNGNVDAGQSYVVFGSRNPFPAALNPATLNGSNGLIINGIAAGDNAGISVSNAGDVNGDGIDDLVIGAFQADANGNGDAGQSYVVFGSRNGFPGVLNLSTLNGNNGFTINGIAAGDKAGRSVSRAGDINGDGIGDLIIGAFEADPDANIDAGQSYVIFGSRTGFPPFLNLSTLNGSNGFAINGFAGRQFSGVSVSGAGDINSDSIDDLIIGAKVADINGRVDAGQSYVVFGRRSGFPAAFSLSLSSLNAINGLQIDGMAAGDNSGEVSNAGDIDGDGVEDLIVGADGADPNGNADAGQSYVLSIRPGTLVAQIDLAAPGTSSFVNSLTLNGIAANDRSGSSVSRAGDINGDGIDDVIIGAFNADSNGNSNAGQSYVLFGVAAPIAGLALTAPLVDASGVTLGAATVDLAAGSLVISNSPRPLRRQLVGFVDVNGTALNDMITGNDANNRLVGSRGNDILLGGMGDDELLGGVGNDQLVGGDGNDRIVGGVGTDRLTGGEGADQFVFDLGARFRRQIGIDVITDFTRRQDKIVLDRTTFTALRGRRVTIATVRTLRQAQQSRSQLVYIRRTGGIFYNPNGAARGFGIGGQFADVANGLNLTAQDFTLVR